MAVEQYPTLDERERSLAKAFFYGCILGLVVLVPIVFFIRAERKWNAEATAKLAEAQPAVVPVQEVPTALLIARGPAEVYVVETPSACVYLVFYGGITSSTALPRGERSCR